MAGELHVEIEPWGPHPDAVLAAAQAALAHPAVVSELDGGEARLLSARPLDTATAANAAPGVVRATIYDYAAERLLVVDTPVEGDAPPVVASAARQPLPTPEEREAAVGVLHEDAELGPALREGRLIAYRSMPPLMTDEREDGTVERTITVGLRPADGGDGHEIVGVRLGRREIARFEGGAPPRAIAARRTCGLPDAGQQTTTGRAGAARITIARGGETLWTLIAVRPAASSGSMGSGVELRAVAYRGRRVLARAHVPILNVRYDRDACGPYRDWQNEESRFQIHGTAPAPGFRLCDTPPTTILESGQDQGNFAGVAVYVDGDEVELVSELEAGWYRYISRWRLGADGTIKARFGFGAVESPCVCNTHHHHAYWRFDFDIGGAGDDAVLEYNQPKLPGQDSNWHTLRHEIRRARNDGRKRKWRVRNRGSGEGYVIVPGAEDGERDGFGVGDFWALKHRPGQIDDAAAAVDDRAALDAFVNGDAIVGTNVVVWYAAHFTHDVLHEEEGEHGHIVGPDLVPDRWV
jgi:hypothetical protein